MTVMSRRIREMARRSLPYSTDTGYRRADYVKDKKKVCYAGGMVKGADAASCRLVDPLKFDAADKRYRYQSGRRL